jgi:DNA-binding NarL/FixJ family response regulator
MSSECIYANKYLSLSPSVKGFINKEADPSEIQKAIVNILNNKGYLSPKMQDILIQQALTGKVHNPFEALSIRELEIMNHLVCGKNVSEIAHILCVHSSTILAYKAKIMHKVGVSNIIELSKMVQMFE